MLLRKIDELETFFKWLDRANLLVFNVWNDKQADAYKNGAMLQMETLYRTYIADMRQIANELSLMQKQIEELTAKYGDKTSQTLGIEIKDSKGNRNANTVFVHDAGDYVRFIDPDNDFMKLERDDGVYITHKLGENENIKVGDTIT